MSFENVEDVYALSPVQEGMLFHTLAEGSGSGVYIDQISTTISGTLDEPRLRRVWEILIARHTSLRTAFLWDGLDEPLQIVRGRVEIPWSGEDWRNRKANDRAWAELLEADRAQGFELECAPLIRMTLRRTGERTWRWLWTFHHLILDGWSTRLLVHEMRQIYDALERGKRPTMPEALAFRDFIGWLASQSSGRAAADTESFWRRELAGFGKPTRLDAYLSSDTAAESGHGQQSLALDTDETQALKDFASRNHVTLATVFQGAWALLLSRYAREHDVAFGVTTAGRPPDLQGSLEAVGLFINTLPMRVRLDPQGSIGDWLRQLQGQQIAARRHDWAALSAIHKWSEVPPGDALFDHILVIENHPEGEAAESSSITLEKLDFFEQSNYPLAMLVVPGAQLELLAVHEHRRFSADLVERILRHYRMLLTNIPRADEKRLLANLPMMGPEERRRLLVDWNATDTSFPKGRLIHDLIAEIAAQNPRKNAVICGDESISYAALMQRSACLADHLRNLGVTVNTPVALLIERSVDMVIGLLGVLRAGGAYIPLDPSYPSAHLQRVLEDSEAPVLLTQQGLAASAGLAARPATVWLDAPQTWIAPEQKSRDVDEQDASPPSDESLAYVLYTSGSTGKPKGVMVSQRNLVHSNAARQGVYGAGAERFLLLSSFAFDSSVAGLFWTLTSGGTLVLPKTGEEQDLEAVARLLEQHQVTHTLCLPALYRLLLEESPVSCLKSLQVVIVAGEACPPELGALHYRDLPATRLFNEYGPTEGTVWSTVHEIDPSFKSASVPIGKPISNVRVYVLDEQRQPVPIGVPGELYLAGQGVAKGYWQSARAEGSPFLTLCLGDRQERVYRTGDLVSYRADGSLLFLGRADSQLKIRGFRIELEGVAAELRRQRQVRDVAVKSLDGPGGARLVAWLELDDGTRSSTSDLEKLRQQLKETLPAYMVPDTLMAVDTIAKTPNGKIDYRALPAITAVSLGREKSKLEGIEAVVGEAWGEVLGHQEFAASDNFFELGGDSILGIQAVSRLRQAGLPAEPRDIAAYSTLAQLAAALATRETRQEIAEPESPTGEIPLSPVQSWLLERQLANPHHWNLSRLIGLPGTAHNLNSEHHAAQGLAIQDSAVQDSAVQDFDTRHLEAALLALVQHHDLLRARFDLGPGGDWRQTLVPLEELETLLSVAKVASDHERQSLIANAQASLDLSVAPLFRATLIETEGKDEVQLLLVTHHLIIDAVSWSFLIEDLALAWRQLTTGEAVTLPAKTASFGRWTRELPSRPSSEHIHFWTRSVDPHSASIPTDHESPEIPTEADARVHSQLLGSELITQLTSEALRPYNTRVDDMLITALAIALAAWRDHRTVRLDLEGHGREGDLDVSRTLGWFTAAYPVELSLPDENDPGAAIRAIKDQLRAVPGDGSSFAILRASKGREAAKLGELPQAEVLFNYLGRAMATTPSLQPIADVDETSRDARNTRSHLLEINAAIRHGELFVDWSYCHNVHRRETLERLATNFAEALRQLVEHCLEDGAGRLTSSDFPEADLDSSDFESLLEQLE